jgi:predicted RNase H-like HicB family nuclease
MANKTLSYYKRLPYGRQLERRIDPGSGTVYYVASIREIPFIRIDAETREDAFLRLSEMFEDCIEGMLAAGDEVPEPDVWPGEGYTAPPARRRPERRAPTPAPTGTTYATPIVNAGPELVSA